MLDDWKDIPGYADYQINRTGQVRRKTASSRRVAGAFISSHFHRQGYVELKLSANGVRKSFLAHRLVMLAFVGECPEGMEVNHKNGNKADNRVENLEYTTPRLNTRHAVEHLGRQAPKGTANARSKLNDDKIRAIRKALQGGASVRQLAREYGVSSVAIYDIRDGKVWKHVK